MDTRLAPSADQVAIQALLDARHRALLARDAKAVAATWTPDIRVFDLAPPLQSIGAAPEEESLRGWIASKQGPIEEQLQNVRITCGDDVAFATALARLRTTEAGGGATHELWMRVTLGLVRDADGWRMAHIHGSVPFQMDGSLRAAIDLRP